MPSFVQPKTWSLAGGGVHVRYSTAGPTLHYQDNTISKEFSGSQIDVAGVPQLGMLVSVTLQLTVDSGSTTFTLMLPRVNLPPPPELPVMVPVTTDAITARHDFSLVPAFDRGQQDFYSVTQLQGTAG